MEKSFEDRMQKYREWTLYSMKINENMTKLSKKDLLFLP